MKRYWYVLILILILVVVGIFIWQKQKNQTTISSPINQTIKPIISPSPSPTNANTLVFPIAEFQTRITKKPFGLYVTPQNSPVQPEHFTGYHTGTDIEYQDVTSNVPVYAINNGTIALARTASGYGGVILMQTQINGTLHSVVYGHIRPSSLPKVGATVTKGEQIGLLGTGYSSETDGERRHLHFAVLSNSRVDIAGYVQTKSTLAGWLDPVTLYQ